MAAARNPVSTTEGEDMPAKVRRRNGAQYRTRQPAPDMDSEGLRIFREETAGLSNRLQMPSIEPMRAGLVQNPISLMRRFMRSMRQAGLPKERALRVIVQLQRTADSIWPMESTPLAVLQERAMRAEGEDDVRELRCGLETSAITLRERIASLTNEIVCDQLTLAALERRMEDTAK